jgi:hypothetical protein
VETKGALGLGEIALFERILKKAKLKLDQKLQEKIDVDQIDHDISHYIKEEYLREIKRRSFADNRLIIDSTPSNYQHVGLIVKLFPSAKLIYCHRDPLDHILQVYFKYFAEGNGYSYDLLKLTHFYVDYCRLIAFWKKNMVTQMMEVNYEDLIKTPKDTIVKICQFVEVNVPQPLPKLHHREIGLWKNYNLYFEIVKMILKKNGFQGM